MPTTTLRPNGASSTQWTASGAATTWQATGDGLQSTRAQTSLAGRSDLHQLADLPANAAAITSLVLWVSALGQDGFGDGGQVAALWQLGGTLLVGATQVLPVFDQWDWSTDLVGQRPGGGSWAVADVNALLIGYRSIAVDANATVPIAIFDAWVIAGYTVAASGRAGGRTRGFAMRRLGILSAGG